MKSRFFAAPVVGSSLALALFVSGSCSDSQDTVVNQLNLDRPVDIAFACHGGERLTGGDAATPDNAGNIVTSAMALQACDIRSTLVASGSGSGSSAAVAAVPPGQETINDRTGKAQTTGASQYIGLILQNETGTVAISHWDTKPSSGFSGNDVSIDDSDPFIPGKNGIPVGEDPVAIASSTEGCYALTANAGSCDLSTIDITSAKRAINDTSGARAIVNRLAVTNAAGQVIRAKPAAMVAQPASGTIGGYRQPDGTINACPATPTGLVYIAYPACHLVAGVDASTGRIVNSIAFDANGLPTLGNGNVSCADECAGNVGITAPGTRPITLALERDARSQRTVLAVGLQDSNVVTVVDLDISSVPTSATTVPLEQNRTNDLGVTSVAVSPTIGMGGVGPMINDDSAFGGDAQFLYAIASDHTVRVVDFDATTPPARECDTQVDPRYLHDELNVNLLSCLPLQPARRRAGARGPGVQFPGQGIPTSIGVFRVEGIDGTIVPDGDPLKLVGYFGVITASNGATYVLNIDNDNYADTVDSANPVGTAIPLDIANQLRDAVPHRNAVAQAYVTGTGSGSGSSATQMPICNTYGTDPASKDAPSDSTRFTGQTSRLIPGGTLATEKIGALPAIRQVACFGSDVSGSIAVSELSFAAPLPVRDQEFPDLLAIPYQETLTLTYEGSLSIDTSSTAANGPAVRTSMMNVDADGIRLVDQTHPYCDAGVQPWDIVQLRGCDATLGDGDCPLGYSCFVSPESQVANLGSCLRKDEADRLANACKAFLVSERQYTVGKATSGELKLIPRKHVLRTTPLEGCQSDAQCQTLGNFLVANQSASAPIAGNFTADPHHYTCAPDPQRAPDPTTGKPLARCIETCSTTADCDAGAVCDNGTCYDGVIPPQACVNAPQRYELRASEAFVVAGTTAGYNHPIIQDASGSCVVDPKASRFDIGRIPLKAPACDPTANPFSGLLPDGVTYEPNPCSATVDQTEFDNNYVPGTCTPATPATSLVTRSAPAIRFHGRGQTLTLVDPTYPGDSLCIGDRQGGLGNIPVVPPLFQESVVIVSGFSPLLITLPTVAYPVKVVRGPQESIWIMDDGDYLSTSISVPSTRGKVFRVESPAIRIVNVLQ